MSTKSVQKTTKTVNKKQEKKKRNNNNALRSEQLESSLWFDVEKNNANCNVEITISHSGKKFSKNSSLVTRSAVSCWDIEAYSANSPYTTRHHTCHPNRCMLLRMCMLYIQFTLDSLATLKMGDE